MSRFWLGVVCFFSGAGAALVVTVIVCLVRAVWPGDGMRDELAEDDDFRSPPGELDA